MCLTRADFEPENLARCLEDSQARQQGRISQPETSTPKTPVKKYYTRAARAALLIKCCKSPSGRVSTDSPYEFPEDMNLTTEDQDEPDTVPIISHESPPWGNTSELDADDEMVDEPLESMGQSPDIEKHHFAKIQAIVGDHLGLHPWSSFPRNGAEIEQAAAMLQSSEKNPEPHTRADFSSTRVASPSSSAEDKSPGWSADRVFTLEGSPSFCMIGPRDEKRRRLNHRNPFPCR